LKRLQQQQLRVVDDGAGERDATLLSFAQVVNPDLGLFPDSKHCQEKIDPLGRSSNAVDGGVVV